MLDSDSDDANAKLAAWLGQDLSRLEELLEIYRRAPNDVEAARLMVEAYRPMAATLEREAGVVLDKVFWPAVVRAMRALGTGPK